MRKVFSDCYTNWPVSAPPRGPISKHASLKEDPVLAFKHGGKNPPDRSGAITPRSRSHDQPNPKAFPWSVNSSLHILCLPPPPSLFFTPPACPQMQEQYCKCVFGPRCGRAAQSVSSPGLPTMLREERCKQGSTIIDGFSKNSASGSTPPQSSDLWPPINIPAIWQTQRERRVGPPFSIQQCGVCSD